MQVDSKSVIGSVAKSSVYPKVRIKTFLKIIMGQSPPSYTYNQNGDGLPFFQGVSDFGPICPSTRIWCSSPKKLQSGDRSYSLYVPQ